jgi:glutamate-1-semialdehyde 2,1-aminomutase
MDAPNLPPFSEISLVSIMARMVNVSSYPISAGILRKNQDFISGGVISINRSVQPEIVFTKAEGAYLWDAEGNRYIDYHAAFAPHFLGHNDAHVSEAVKRAIDDGWSLFGSGTTKFEGKLAELVCTHIPWVERVQFLNTGSEGTSEAIRLARAATARDHIIVMQGGYNGWHNDVACNLMTPLSEIGPRVSPGEYRFASLSAGIPEGHSRLVHAINFNDLDSVRYVCERYPIACLITEPILQNIGIVHPQPGYLKGLRKLADEFGFILIFDEVKTGFRHSIGGYSEIAGVVPDLVVYGKAIANGYPLAALGGKKELMDYFVHPDASKRVLLAGTYNAHPLPTAAAIATIERLLENKGEVYAHTQRLGALAEKGIREIAAETGITVSVARQGSAFCVYLMNHLPVDWHDLASHHDFAVDAQIRKEMIGQGIYFFPLPVKQCSISAAHSEHDIAQTLEAFAHSCRHAVQVA